MSLFDPATIELQQLASNYDMRLRRDTIAQSAMLGLLVQNWHPERVPEMAYKLADAMLAFSAPKQTPPTAIDKS